MPKDEEFFQGITPEDIRALRESNAQLLDYLKVRAEPPINTNTNTVNTPEGHWVAAWICTICCTITLTIVILGKMDQVDQGSQIRRIQDHETIILQYTPQWLKDIINESDRKKR